MFHKFFQPIVIPEYHSVMESEVLKMLEGLREDPEKYDKHVRRYVSICEFQKSPSNL